MIHVSPCEMLAAGSVVKFVAKKAVLAIEQEMKQRPAGGKYPHPSAETRAGRAFDCFASGSDYCTFFAGEAGFAAAGVAAAVTSTSVAD
jgi:hypothetical protein